MTESETYKKADQDYQLAYAAYLSRAITIQELQAKQKAKAKAFSDVKKAIKARL